MSISSGVSGGGCGSTDRETDLLPFTIIRMPLIFQAPIRPLLVNQKKQMVNRDHPNSE